MCQGVSHLPNPQICRVTGGKKRFCKPYQVSISLSFLVKLTMMKTSLGRSGQSITYWALGWDRPALCKLVNCLGIHPFWAHLFTKIDQQNWWIDYEFTQTFWSLFTSFSHKGRLQKVKKQKLDTARTVSCTTHLLQTRSFSIWMPSQEIQDPPFKPQFGGFKRIFCVHPDPCEIMKSDLMFCFNGLETHHPPATWHTPLPR